MRHVKIRRMKPLYIFWGKVRHGKHLGKKFGYPTANVYLHKDIPEGIYISTVKVQNDQRIYPSVTFIGAAEMFGETEKKAEVHIFDFKKTIYDSFVTVRLLKKIRNNQRFASEKALIDQIEKDVVEARKFFKNI
jgi:riboflavin kinase / FMN adenylyltransferase